MIQLNIKAHDEAIIAIAHDTRFVGEICFRDFINIYIYPDKAVHFYPILSNEQHKLYIQL
jgi:hypothetical protein